MPPVQLYLEPFVTAVVAAMAAAGVTYVVMRRRLGAVERRLDQQRRESADLQRVNAALQRYASSLAHDLRSPVALIVSTLELLRTRLELDDRQAHLVETAVRRGRRCVEIAGELLDQARLAAEHIERGPVPLGEVLDDALDQLAAEIDERRPALRIDPLPTVAGNRPLLVQVFQNLLSNAMRHAAGSDPVRVVVSSTVVDGMARIVVADDGPGIPPRQRELVFRYGLTTNVEGTGIGLATVRSLVASHGGTVHVETSPLGGTGIVVTLPLASAAERVIELDATPSAAVR